MGACDLIESSHLYKDQSAHHPPSWEMEAIDTLQPLGWLIKQFAEQHPTLEVAVENRCRHDVCLPDT